MDAAPGGPSERMGPRLPVRIGRYQIVGSLGSGGMAQILLGRRVGPSGFERAVVVKRMLPHLAEDEAFVQMFLDEARLVAGIRHRNVVQVFELDHDEGETFLVMEYLEGESLHGLMRRLVSRKSRLPMPLAVHVIAEACAGLHAAHELRDDEGHLLEVVHRDVSPQNLFVTYDGGVKVLDFGIAKAADRITRTATGQIKGKFAYMAPEQIMAADVDRRADVFSLGIVLHEVLTGQRLFARANELLTLSAVRDEPIRPPSRVVADVPPVLDEVCMRALARDRDARFESAEAMRRALLEAQRTFDGPSALDSSLSALMHDLFGERIAEKREMLRRVKSGSEVTQVPRAEVDLQIEIPQAISEEATIERARPSPKRTARWAVPAALALVAAAAAGVYVVLGGGDPTSTAVPGALAAGTEQSGSAPEGTELRREGPATPSATTPSAGALPAMVRLRVEGSPEGARVLVEGVERGRLPATIEVARSTEPVEVRVEQEGYRVFQRTVAPENDRDLFIALVRARSATRSTKRPPAAGPPEPATERPAPARPTTIERF